MVVLPSVPVIPTTHRSRLGWSLKRGGQRGEREPAELATSDSGIAGRWPGPGDVRRRLPPPPVDRISAESVTVGAQPVNATKRLPGVHARESKSMRRDIATPARDGRACRVDARRGEQIPSGAPNSPDAPSQSMVGSLRSCLERSRKPATRRLACRRPDGDALGAAPRARARRAPRGDREDDPRRDGSVPLRADRSGAAAHPGEAPGRQAAQRRQHRPAKRPAPAEDTPVAGTDRHHGAPLAAAGGPPPKGRTNPDWLGQVQVLGRLAAWPSLLATSSTTHGAPSRRSLRSRFVPRRAPAPSSTFANAASSTRATSPARCT